MSRILKRPTSGGIPMAAMKRLPAVVVLKKPAGHVAATAAPAALPAEVVLKKPSGKGAAAASTTATAAAAAAAAPLPMVRVLHSWELGKPTIRPSRKKDPGEERGKADDMLKVVVDKVKGLQVGRKKAKPKQLKNTQEAYCRWWGKEKAGRSLNTYR